MASLTFDEILAKADNITRLTGDIQGIIKSAQAATKAGSDGGKKVTASELTGIKDKIDEAIDELQALGDEILEDLQD